jgi:cytochrome d ubiquinol oxidase subunit II
MFSFESFLDLPLVWYSLIGTAIFLYILLDGFDLGVGILFPFAPSDQCRDRMMNSIAPFWDGNETWLVLGGGGLFAAFPLAYAILMPAFYIPIILMLLGLIFRGVAFEFRFKATGKSRRIWDTSFHFGSLTATFMQGMVLGTFVHGIAVDGRNFSGGAAGLAECLQHHDRRCPGDRIRPAGRHLDDHENRGRHPGVGPAVCQLRAHYSWPCSWGWSA